MKIIAIITTKNRLELFGRALASAVNQTRKPDRLIVVSDSSPDIRREEEKLTKNCGAELIADEFTRNYAGSLNSAIHHVLKSEISGENDWNSTYIATLDDDDLWAEEYLEECEGALKGEDFVVSGLVYCNEEGRRELTIPEKLTVDSFLKGNPHIQGSNTFIKLSTLMRAGLFDENMSSTTDRDIFTRVMLLKPTYAVCNKYLVEVDAYNSRERITNGKAKKAEGLRKFYYKYNGYMSDEIKEGFFGRAQNLFGVGREEIENIPLKSTAFERNFSKDRYDGNLTVGFIVTEYKLGLRLLKQLTELKRKNTKIVIFMNFTEDRAPYLEMLNDSGYRYEIIDRKRVLARLEKGGFDQFVTEDKLRDEVIRDIAVTRTILQKYLYECTCDGDTVWVLDEDMELFELLSGVGVEKVPLDIDRVIATYQSDYDAVVGNYALDAPLPTLSTLRTSLLDFVYNKTAKIGDTDTLSDYTDYYYDLSDYGNVHLETPIKIESESTLDGVFSGKAVGRPLVLTSAKISEVKSRGGNTLIFNRELLTLPNWSIQIGDKIGRRSDYFWAWQAKRRGYRLANVPFATLHNRSACPFDIKKEEGKLLLDIIGSSFTKAIERVGTKAKREEFFEAYSENFITRLVKYALSFYRINGLLSILDDKKYSEYFSVGKLKEFLYRAESYVAKSAVLTAYDAFQRRLYMQSQMIDSREIQSSIEKRFSLPENVLKLLGNGGEGAVFTDGKFVYKYFFEPLKNADFLKKIGASFRLCGQLHPLEFFDADGATVIRYPYEKSEPYKSGHAREFASLLRFAKENGFGYDNFKKENFVIADGKLKLVDYGKSFLPYSEELHEKSIKRVYQMLRYHFLDDDGFKQIIQRSYQNDTVYIDDGYKLFEEVVKHRYKEQLHDDIVLGLAEELYPESILDYGAGKCKIANALSQRYSVEVFDIDKKILKERADKKVKIFERAVDIPSGKYDLILNNLVLCCVENDTAEEIVRNIVKALKRGGKALISICNPFFNGVENTELRTSGLKGEYKSAETFLKRTAEAERREYHRPIEYYINLFERNGLILESVTEGRGADVDTLLPIAEHIVFVCKKECGETVYGDCTLLIKTNPMEHRTIYRNIRHIVCALEKGGRFEKRIVVADLTKTDERARRYDGDDENELKRELKRAKSNGLVDEIIYAEDNAEEMKRVYGKYFGVYSESGHSANGQGIYATLLGFEAVKTKYVFQTDSDILYFNKGGCALSEGLEELKRGRLPPR